MSDEDDHGSDASIEPVTEAELEAELAAPSGSSRARRAPRSTRTPRTPSATVTFFSLATPGESNRRGSWNGTGPRTARQRVCEETRDALVDVEARVRHAKKQTREAREKSASGSEEV